MQCVQEQPETMEEGRSIGLLGKSVNSSEIQPENPFDEIIKREQTVKKALKTLSELFLSSIKAFYAGFANSNDQKPKKKAQILEQLAFLISCLEYTIPMRVFHEEMSMKLKLQRNNLLIGVLYLDSRVFEIKHRHKKFTEHCSDIMTSYAILLRCPKFGEFMDQVERKAGTPVDFSTLLYDVFRHPVNLQLVVERLCKFCQGQTEMEEELKIIESVTNKINQVVDDLNSWSPSGASKIFNLHEKYSSTINILTPNRLYLNTFEWGVIEMNYRRPLKTTVHVMNDLVLVVRSNGTAGTGAIVASIEMGPETKVDDLKEQRTFFHLFRLRCKGLSVIFKADTKEHKTECIRFLNEILMKNKGDKEFSFVPEFTTPLIQNELCSILSAQKEILDLDVSVVGTRERSYGSFMRHTEYLIKIVDKKDMTYEFSRRYSDFYNLYQFIKSAYSDCVNLPRFPPKTALKFSPKVLEIRKLQLEVFIYFLLQNDRIPKSDNFLIQQFFGIDIKRYFNIMEIPPNINSQDDNSTRLSDRSSRYSSSLKFSPLNYAPAIEIMQEEAKKKIEVLNKEESTFSFQGIFCVATVDVCNLFELTLELSVTTRAMDAVRIIAEKISLKYWSDFKLQILEVDGYFYKQRNWRFLTDEEFIGISSKEFKASFKSTLKRNSDHSMYSAVTKNLSFSKFGRCKKTKKNELCFEKENEEEIPRKETYVFNKSFKQVKLRLVKYFYWDKNTEGSFMMRDQVRAHLILKSIADTSLKRKQKGSMGCGFADGAHSFLIAMTYLGTTENIKDLFQLENEDWEEYRFKNIEHFLPVVIYSAMSNEKWENEAAKDLRLLVQNIKEINQGIFPLSNSTLPELQKIITKRFFFVLRAIFPQYSARVFRVEATSATQKLLSIKRSSGYCLFQVSNRDITITNEHNSERVLWLKYKKIDCFELKTNSIMLKKIEEPNEYTFDSVMAFEIYELCLTYYENSIRRKTNKLTKNKNHFSPERFDNF